MSHTLPYICCSLLCLVIAQWGIARTGIEGWISGTPADLPQSGHDFWNQRSDQVQNRISSRAGQNCQCSFRFYFSEEYELSPVLSEPSRNAQTIKPASLVPPVFEKSSRRTLGKRQNRQVSKKGPPSGSQAHFLTPLLFTPFLQPPDN